MAYDRYDTRNDPRSDRSRWRDDRNEMRGSDRDRERGGSEDRGFFERAGDEIASWFGDDDAERRRRYDRRDERSEGRHPHDREAQGRFFGSYRDEDRGRSRPEHSWSRSDFERDDDRGRSFFGGQDRDEFLRGRSDLNRGEGFGSGFGGQDRGSRSFGGEHERGLGGGGYRPLTGDYGRASDDRSGYRGDDDYRTGFSSGDRFRQTSFGGPRGRSGDFDPHYNSWRDRHMGEMDRDYDDYRRENQSRFEDDFGKWRDRRQQKRGLLGQIREHMEVVGNDGQHVGTIDRVAGDRVILTKSDPESGGAHHSFSCSDIDRVEGERIILDCNAEQAKQRWRDESRSRALFEREDQGEMGPRVLDRSFEGTYRDR